MSIALQVALFLASLAIVALVVCIVPIAIQVGRSLRHLGVTTERLEATVETLLQDSRELVRNVGDLSDRTKRNMEEMEKVVRIAQLWTERVDQFVRQIGSIVEPPMLSLFRNSKVLRMGVAVFLQTLLNPHRPERPKDQHNPTREEQNHV